MALAENNDLVSIYWEDVEYGKHNMRLAHVARQNMFWMVHVLYYEVNTLHICYNKQYVPKTHTYTYTHTFLYLFVQNTYLQNTYLHFLHINYTLYT